MDHVEFQEAEFVQMDTNLADRGGLLSGPRGISEFVESATDVKIRCCQVCRSDHVN